MSQSLVAAFVVFGAVMAFTPGPNNIMVLSSGLTYGFRRSLPHISGIAIGVSLMVASVGLGLGTDLSRLSGAADHPEICRHRLSDLFGRHDRDVRVGHAGEATGAAR